MKSIQTVWYSGDCHACELAVVIMSNIAANILVFLGIALHLVVYTG